MKKTLILAILCATFYAPLTFAQGFKSFISDMTVDLSVGATWGHYDKVYPSQKFGFGCGIDITKPITNFNGKRSSLYGLVGLHAIQKNASRTGAFDKQFETGEDVVASRASVPIHVGYRYQLKKISLFVHAGPYVSFSLSDNEDNAEDVELSSSEVGLGVDFGIKFKRFAFSFGLDQGLTKIVSCKENDALKATTPHLMLVWSLGKK